MIEWHNAQKETPPIGKALLLNHFANGNNWEDRPGFYARQDTKEEDFEPSCINMLTCLNGDNTFYRYYIQKGVSRPVHSVIEWALAPQIT